MLNGFYLQVLIVEDNRFNAMCLSRLIQSMDITAHIKVASSSKEALAFCKNHPTDLAILDGNLGLEDPLQGPLLAEALWKLRPSLPMVAWTTSPTVQQMFAKVFQAHNRPFDMFSCWNKVMDPVMLKAALTHFKFPCIVAEEARCA